MLKMIFCGDRNWHDRDAIVRVIETLRLNLGDFILIEGEARGADSISRDVALEKNLSVERFPADWKTFGSVAGSIRNQEMLRQSPLGVVAFHEDIEKSRGTRHMIKIARERAVPVWVSSEGPEALAEFILQVKQRLNQLKLFREEA